MIEKRLYHRLLIDTEIEHQNMNADSGSRGKTKDISIGGICITTEGEPLNREDMYALSFTLPGDREKLEVKGKVVWIKKYKAGVSDLFDNGIEFIDPDNDFLNVIEDYSIGAVAGDSSDQT
jgi:Tfp pilus assembly protein PilZ